MFENKLKTILRIKFRYATITMMLNLFFISSIIGSCYAAGGFHVVTKKPSTVPISTPVSYSCTFVNRWTAMRHPNHFPNPGVWSPMVIVGHSPMYTMWSDEQKASLGIEMVAEVSNGIMIRRHVLSQRTKMKN